MEKYVAVVFDTENQAYAGAEALRDLHRKGDVTVNAAAVLGRNAEGRIELKKAQDEGPFGTALGLAVGGILGLLAGPAAIASGAAAVGSAAAAQAAMGGMLAGSATGGFVGLFRDIWVHDVDAAVLDKVSAELESGDYCVVASIEESWTTPLDSKMAEVGGIVFRKARIQAEDEIWEADIRALNRELDELEDELSHAHQENKASVQAKIDNVKARIQANNERVAAKFDQWDAETEQRLGAIDEQIDTATEQTRQKFVERKEKLQAQHEARKLRYQQQQNVTREVLAA